MHKKAGYLKWKAGKRDGAKKKCEFTPESGSVDTYARVSKHLIDCNAIENL